MIKSLRPVCWMCNLGRYHVEIGAIRLHFQEETDFTNFWEAMLAGMTINRFQGEVSVADGDDLLLNVNDLWSDPLTQRAESRPL